MEPIRIGIIGGTGVYQLPGVEHLERVEVETEYGTVPVNTGTLGGKRIAFLTRHGEHHSISPAQINYRANIMALKQLGVKQVYATACSGSINPAYPTGSFVLIEQFLDFTKGRPASFYYNDGSQDKPIAHIDLTNPYCSRLGAILKEAGRALEMDVKEGATYVCMEGPRFESAAEIKMMRVIGGNLVAHTQYPEVALAREAEMCYAAVGIVSNMAAGIEDEHVSAVDVKTNMAKLFGDVQQLLAKAVELTPEEDGCWCQEALSLSFV